MNRREVQASISLLNLTDIRVHLLSVHYYVTRVVEPGGLEYWVVSRKRVDVPGHILLRTPSPLEARDRLREYALEPHARIVTGS